MLKTATVISDRRSTPRPMVQHKSGIPFDVKAIDENARTFRGLAAAWSLDHGGDVIRKGAFARTLANWRASKKQKPIPLIDQHGYMSVNQILGRMIEAEETEDGLLATFQMIANDPNAEAAFRRVKDGVVTGLSIGYEPVVSEAPSEEERRRGIWRYLKEVKLREVSLVIWPMNDDARVDTESAKALIARLRGKSLTDPERSELEAIRDAIDALLASTDPSVGDVETDSAKHGLAPDDPKRLQLEELFRDVTLRSLATR
jgi:uncharacterized protein